MEITVFAKKRTSKTGKDFYSYLTTLTRKDGSECVATVRFRDGAGYPDPERCPMNLIVDRSAANMATRSYKREDTGEMAIAYTLWVTAWKEGKPFVDSSLDEFDV